jgi:hypothetical protein
MHLSSAQRIALLADLGMKPAQPRFLLRGHPAALVEFNGLIGHWL